MSEIFDIDTSDLKRLRKFYKRAPKMFGFAAAGVMNGFAFGTRKKSIKVIDSKMTVRNPKFIHGSIQVRKAFGNQPLSKIESKVGSIERPRYTGLREQETGETPSRNRTFTRAARDGVKTRPAKGWARLKPNAKYSSPSGAALSGLSGAKRIVAFLHILSERRAAQTFILKKRFGRFKRGLYRFKQGVIRKLQSFDNKHKPKRIKWLTEGKDNYFASVNLLKLWADAIQFQLNKFK